MSLQKKTLKQIVEFIASKKPEIKTQFSDLVKNGKSRDAAINDIANKLDESLDFKEIFKNRIAGQIAEAIDGPIIRALLGLVVED